MRCFEEHVPGRLCILCSCGTLNEGVDTTGANMAVALSPSQSIVKEAQRIGRLIRIAAQERARIAGASAAPTPDCSARVDCIYCEHPHV